MTQRRMEELRDIARIEVVAQSLFLFGQGIGPAGHPRAEKRTGLGIVGASKALTRPSL